MIAPAPVDLAALTREIVPEIRTIDDERARERAMAALESAHLAGQRLMRERIAKLLEERYPLLKYRIANIRALVPEFPGQEQPR